MRIERRKTKKEEEVRERRRNKAMKKSRGERKSVGKIDR